MVITIDLSRLPTDLRSMILKEIKIGEDLTETEQTRDLTTTSNNIKQRLKDTLIKNKIRDYVVMVNLEDQNKIIILKKEHAKSLGIHHCPHCGMEFENEIQLSVHQRIHYMV